MWQIYSFKNEKKIGFEPGACTGGSQGPKGPPLNLLGGAKGGAWNRVFQRYDFMI